MLHLKDIRKELPFKINSPICLHYLNQLVSGAYNTTIDFDVFLPSKGKNLQRPFCWTLFQKQQLIISVLKGIELTPLSIITFSDDMAMDRFSVHKIIDGKQRLSTLFSFLKNEFQIEWNDELFYFKDLGPDAQRAINLLNLKAYVVYEYPDAMISDDNKIAWFEMINFAGTPQDIEHLNNLKS